MEEKIAALLEKATGDIQARMASEGINASGRSSASWRVERYPGGVRLVYGGTEAAPLATLEVGRPGGRVPMGFTAILEQWSRDKGLSFPTDKDRRRFAYLLGKRIEKVGTLRHAANVDVYSTIVTDTAAQVKGALAVTITQHIHQHLIDKA